MATNKRLIKSNDEGGVATSFNTVIWDGEVGSGSRDFSGVGFQPDLVWVKRTSSADDHHIYDSVRGAGVSKVLASNKTAAEPANNAATYGYLDAFLPDGFSTVSGSANNAFFNENNQSMVAWCWKAGGAAVSGTGTNAQNITYSANPDAGFSIVKFSTNGSASYTATHGLNQEPDLVITKATSAGANWISYVKGLGVSKYLFLDTTAAAATYSNLWNGMSSTHIGGVSAVYGGTNTFVNYCFHSVDGYQKVGSYSYNPSGDKRVYTTSDGTSTGTGGFQPRWVMIKKTNDTSNWVILDSIRVSGNLDGSLSANTSNAENITSDRIEFHSDGFTVIGSNTATNTGDHIYLAIA